MNYKWNMINYKVILSEWKANYLLRNRTKIF